ncbi:MAG: amidohydrolase family protein, partial [Bacillota bacterium]|nr:amidohydrolase family protein [Bacillota bacterium]
MRTLIKKGRIIDGSGSPAYWADLLIDDDLITAILPREQSLLDSQDGKRQLLCDKPEQADQSTFAADRVIDAAGLTITPGFVDSHRHGDLAVLTDPDYGILELAQGITTVINGNCGMSLFPTAEATRKDWYQFLEPCLGQAPSDLAFADFTTYRQAAQAAGPRINVGTLAGTGAVRTAVKGMARTPYTPDEIDQAQAHMTKSLQAGALGASAGIMYVPERYTSADEYAAILRPVAAQDALLSCHIRGEGDSLVTSIEEIIAICRSIGLRLNISHFKAIGIKNWHRLIHQAIETIEKADADVTVDFYPYLGGSTTLMTLLPPTVIQDNLQETLAQLNHRSGIERVRSELEKRHPGWDSMVAAAGWDRIIISSVGLAENEACVGRTLADIARSNGTDPVSTTCALLASEKGNVSIITMSMDQADLDTIARLPWSMVVSDSLYSGTGKPHPRLYGAFPKIVRDMVYERKILTLEQAIFKMSAKPADRHGLIRRGQIRTGWYADLNLFDPEQLRDQADYTDPRQLTTGMKLVLVNGQISWMNDQTVSSVEH